LPPIARLAPRAPTAAVRLPRNGRTDEPTRSGCVVPPFAVDELEDGETSELLYPVADVVKKTRVAAGAFSSSAV